MLKFFRLPFATTGDKTAVPDAVDSNGNVSYSQGYGFDYQRQKTDPAAKNIERDKMNQILFDITTAIAEIQSQGAPDYITPALNGGTAYSYAQYAIVKYSGALYISLAAANTALPSDATKWALLPTPALLQQSAYMSANAAGTVDAITAAFTPAIAALPAAPGTLSVFVRATGANTSTTPTFKADGTAAKTIVKGSGAALVAGDIAGNGHWIELQYDATLDKWVLLNPAMGTASTAPQFDSTKKVSTTEFCRLNGINHAPWSTYTVAGTILTASDCGRAVQIQLPADGTIYLPLTSACASGAAIHIVNTSATAKVTIVTQAPDALFFAPLVLLPSEDVWMIASPPVATWFPAGGTGVLQSVGAFSRSIGGSGYQKLPGGLIIQWGQVGNPANYVGGSAYAFNLPIAFPNNHHLLIASNFGGNNLCEATQGQIGGLTQGKIVWAANHSAAGSVAATYISIGN